LARLVRAMQFRRVLVVGDVMLDEFLWGRVSRISPEAPVPVVEVTRQSFHVGGAGNVAANVRSLGGRAALVGLVGADDAGARVRQALERIGVEPQLVVSSDGRPTTVKTRIVAHHQQVVRADREQAGPVGRPALRALVAALRARLAAAEVVIVSDYHKGVVSAGLLRPLRASARARGLSVLVDPKLGNFRHYRGVTLVTPNQHEAEQATGLVLRGEREVEAAGRRMLTRLGCRGVLVTRGEHGLSLCQRGRRALHVRAAAREVYDVTGAGDTVIATLALALAAGASLAEAAVIANQAAGVVVGKLGTAQVSADELLRALRASAARAPR
jgi:D-beta-D-heptose 7-phosphate kinase/D-beta-D-heptose 1-phosphate adenosyltransferase